MERLTKRVGNKILFAKGRPTGCFCSKDFCDNVYWCDKIRDRICPYLRVMDKLAEYEDKDEVNNNGQTSVL